MCYLAPIPEELRVDTGTQDANPQGADPPPPRQVLREVLLVYLATLLAIKAVVTAQRQLGLPSDVLILVPLLFMYAPILWLRRVGEDPDDYGMLIEGIRPALKLNALMYLAIFPGFILLNHLYQDLIFHRSPSLRLPDDLFVDVILYHLLYVALPEEFFYRGYVQGRLDRIFPHRWTTLGVSWGWSLPLTAVLFTAGHSIVELRWWHFSILFPALLFGWIRARSPNVVASTLFHAACNITMVLLDTAYGVGLKP